MQAKQYKAVKYIRLSYTDDNDGSESNSVINQRKLLDGFLEKNPDIEAVSEKVDDGWSGIVYERPAFNEMMEDIKAGKINCVIVKDLSRLGREYIDTGRYLRSIFPAYGVRFIAVTDNIDTLKDSGDDLAVSVKSIINDAYCRDISVKTRSALAVKRGNGDYVGACTVYGYKKSEENRNRLVIDEYPAGVVRDIFRMRLEGTSAARIADILNNMGVLSPMEYKRDRGLPHPTGGYADKADAKWSATTVIRILKDETYAGTLIQGRKSTFNYKVKDLIDLPENEWARTEDAHDAIVHPRDFDLVQRVMRLDTRTAPGNEKVYLFSGVLICGSCGGRMIRKTDRKNGKEYNYYCCLAGKKNGCKAPLRIKEDELTACVLESVKSHIVSVVSLDSILKSAGGEAAAVKLTRQYEAQIAENEHQLDQINGFKSTLYENMINGLITKDDYKTLKSRYIEDGILLTQAVSALKQELDDVRAGKDERLRWVEHFKRFEGLAGLDRKTVIHLIQNIKLISKTELQITFNYQAEFDNALALCGSNEGAA
ncbi:MAG: recombinase family protein [Clostridiales bacterium]|jgi:DNA invertase Pin-like site-specific DNA recombinase|nr:recombinase family protein [Clostridiales bacterium]